MAAVLGLCRCPAPLGLLPIAVLQRPGCARVRARPRSLLHGPLLSLPLSHGDLDGFKVFLWWLRRGLDGCTSPSPSSPWCSCAARRPLALFGCGRRVAHLIGGVPSLCYHPPCRYRPAGCGRDGPPGSTHRERDGPASSRTTAWSSLPCHQCPRLTSPAAGPAVPGRRAVPPPPLTPSPTDLVLHGTGGGPIGRRARALPLPCTSGSLANCRSATARLCSRPSTPSIPASRPVAVTPIVAR